jgi:hypothetical protein
MQINPALWLVSPVEELNVCSLKETVEGTVVINRFVQEISLLSEAVTWWD